jgi:hypothetical protein
MPTEDFSPNAFELTVNLGFITIRISPRSIFQWISFVTITIIFGFFAFLFVDSDQLRKTLITWLDPSVAQAVKPDPQKPVQPRDMDIGTRERNSAEPPTVDPQDRKTDAEAIVMERPEGTTSSAPAVDLPLRRPIPWRKVYRVRLTTPKYNKSFQYLPLRPKPGVSQEKPIMDIMAGTEELVGTGRIEPVYEGAFDKTLGVPPVPWIEVQYQNRTGWVSGPYLEEMLR